MEECKNALIQENIELLEQLRAALDGVDEVSFTAMHRPFRRGGVGKHVRHVLDHYKALLGMSEGILDYEARTRDPDIEQYPTAAVATIDSIIMQLSQNRLSPSVPEVKHVWGSGEGSVATSLERELQFLASHTVHHMSLVAWIMDSLGFSVPDSFGVAPSTLRYEAQQYRAGA